MSLMLIIYLVGIIPDIGVGAGIMALCLPVFAGLGYMFVDMGSCDLKTYFRLIKRFFVPLFILCLLVAALTPSKQTIQYMAAAKIGEVVVQSEQFKSVSGEIGTTAKKSLDVLNKILDSYQENIK